MGTNQFSFSRLRMRRGTFKLIFSLIVVLVLAGIALLFNQRLAGAETPFWRDDFSEGLPLQEGWYWVPDNADNWILSGGTLQVTTSSSPTRLLREVSNDNFAIETHLIFEPDSDFQFAGLVIYQDNSNFLQFGRAYCGSEEFCAGNGIYFDYVANDGFVDSNFATPVDSLSEAFLRLEHRGDMVKGFYSSDGFTWYEIGTHWIPGEFQINGVGLTAIGAYDTQEPDIQADFDYFEMTEGGGFLPEGFHDGDEGDVPTWACNASGWAADPDDREADVNIEIVVDDQAIYTLAAGEFRQDLLDADVCVDGNCSFSAPLWDLISSYEPHRVDIWAQDAETGDWVLLSNSAKTLTCRTYDIYAFNPETGETQAVTNTPDMHEFSPKWSPDGKMIVHTNSSTNDFSNLGVYITNLSTMESEALQGAESGGFPAWSPNGKWISFDREVDGNTSLFIVLSSGGQPKLVREDASMSSWSPNSQRLVFQRPSDGSIRTVGINGVHETTIEEYGNWPAWSPDGDWIAYEAGGDVWKVRVNNNGSPLGEPIQLTSNPAWEGRPTWSKNSKTIAYHKDMGGDADIWTIPADGGEATWLTGAPVFGDYDPSYSLKGQQIAYASFSPEGQAPRLWAAAYTYDLPGGTFGTGVHPYHFDFEWVMPEPESWSGQGGELYVSEDAPVYDGYVLLRGIRFLRGINYPDGLTCEDIGEINPDQETRFLVGWLPDYGEISYSDAKAHFESLTGWAVWDETMSAELTGHEIIPFSFNNLDAWFNYVCAFTEAPLKMDLRVNYGGDWVESFYEAGHEVTITVTESDGETIKATAQVQTAPREEWGGETGFQTTPEGWDPEQPDLQPYDWVFAQVDNGATARVQLGDIQGEVNFQTNNITGAIMADWLSDPVQVECLDWGSGQDPSFDNKDGGFHFTNGADPYGCSWEGEWDVQPWQDIGVGYFTPDGHWVANAFRDERWMAIWTYDSPASILIEGEHSYYFDIAYSVPEYVDYPPTEPRTFTVAGDIPLYGGHALLGPWGYMPIQVWNGSECEVVSALNPGQPVRFISGWVNDYSMSYEDALAHFNSINIDLFWDGAAMDSASFTMTDLLPFTGPDDRVAYICTFTAEFILIENQADWVNSEINVSAGQSFMIEASGYMSPCSDTYPNGADYCIFYTPEGGEGAVPYENEFGVFPGPELPFMALLGKIGDGEPFYIGAGGTFTAEQDGTLWFTPNDNLRTDNQGAYSVLVWLEP